MKKLVTLLLVLCLVFGLSSAATAAGAPKIQKQPTSQTTDKNGKVTLSFKATNFNATESSWRFIDPVTGDEYTGPELRDLFADIKGFKLTASNQKQTITLEKVPETMHGWEVYVHLVNNGYEIDTDHFRLWCYGLEQIVPAAASLPAPASAPQPEAVPEPEAAPESAPEQPAESQPASAEPEPAAAKAVTVTADYLRLCPVDVNGNLLEDQAASSLTFTDSCNVAVRSDSPVQYWFVNGIRVEPTDRVAGFILMNVTADLSISAELMPDVAYAAAETEPEAQPAPAAEAEPAEQPAPAAETVPEQPAPAAEAAPAEQPDPEKEAEPAQPVPAAEAGQENDCQVTCTGCVFTYHAGGLRSASSGSVPKGAAIIVSSGGDQAGANGYSINGGDPEHIGSSSFRLVIEEDTYITVP